jgi:hypothetical protein
MISNFMGGGAEFTDYLVHHPDHFVILVRGSDGRDGPPRMADGSIDHERYRLDILSRVLHRATCAEITPRPFDISICGDRDALEENFISDQTPADLCHICQP